MECELKKIIICKPQNTVQQMAVKKFTDLPPVNIRCINTIGIYWNLVQFNAVAFTTSLYKIDQLIKEKKALACG